MGSGRFISPKTIEVELNDGGTRLLTGTEVVVNVGTHAAIPNIPGLEAARALTHIEALELECVPSHLIVLGGGYIGIEMAQAYRRFGSRVTIIEPGRQLMGREDADVAAETQAILNREGVEVLLNARPLLVARYIVHCLMRFGTTRPAEVSTRMCSLSVGAPTPSFSAISTPHTPSSTKSPSTWGGKCARGSRSQSRICNRRSLASARRIAATFILAVCQRRSSVKL